MAAIDRFDLTPLDTLLNPNFGQVSLAGWCGQQFNFACDPQELDSRDPEKVSTLLKAKLAEHYRQKEIRFPVEAVLVEEKIAIDREFFLSFAADDARSTFATKCLCRMGIRA